MSGFVLCWHRESAPVPPDVVAALRAAITGRTARPVRERAGSDWVAWHAPSEWAPGAEEALPLELAGWTGTGSLRLDDRRALADRVRDRVGAGAEDDASLAWRSFSAWGEEAPSHWVGDYAVAVVSPTRDRLVATRGTIGVLPCFHAMAGPLVLVGDDPEVIAAVRGVGLALDERAIVEYLATGELATPTISFRVGVRRLPAAHTLVVSRDGSSRVVRHWSLPEPRVEGGRDPREVVQGFRDVLDRAVRDRLRGPTAALLLSGGLDSPTLALSARRAASDVRATAVTISWRRLLAGDDEAAWASRAAGAAGLPHTVIDFAPDIGLPGSSEFHTPEPAPDPEPLVYRAVSAHLATIAPVVLLGEDVDTLLAPATLVEQLRVEGLAPTARAWRAYRAATGRLPWTGARLGFGALQRWRERRARIAPEWMRTEPLDLHRLPDVPPRRLHPSRSRAARALAQSTWGNVLWNDSPAMSGSQVVVLLPYMDPRVIAYCFALPSVPWAQRKSLIREALRGEMPDDLVARPKTPLLGYYAARVAQWRERGAPASLPASVDAWVDVARWRAALDRAAPADSIFAAWRVLELSRWLAQPRAGRV